MDLGSRSRNRPRCPHEDGHVGTAARRSEAPQLILPFVMNPGVSDRHTREPLSTELARFAGPDPSTSLRAGFGGPSLRGLAYKSRPPQTSFREAWDSLR